MSAPPSIGRTTRAQSLAVVVMLALGGASFGSSAQTHEHATPPQAKPPPADHSQTDHAAHATPPRAHSGPDLPPVTDADRAAAFPDVHGHAAHDDRIQYLVLFDQLDWQDGDNGSVASWDAMAWAGRDLDKLWLRTEGERSDGATESLDVEMLWGHAFARWWELVAGARHDFEPGSSQTWAAFGVQGVAPYKFEVQATAYVGESGRAALELEAEYELLVTNRLILQPLVELRLNGKDDPERGMGSGLSTTELGLRLRYEIRREFAPYVGVTWERKSGDTADFARLNGEPVEDTRWLVGLRFWF
jgi:copper resistance protein B